MSPFDVLGVLAGSEPLDLIEISDRTGHPEGSVEEAIRALIADGRLKVGRRERAYRRPRDLRDALRRAGSANLR